MKLLSSLVAVSLSLSVGIEHSHKWYRAQKTKTRRRRSPLKQESIQKKITEVRPASLIICEGVHLRSLSLNSFPLKLREKRAEVETMMDVVFKGIFLKRYR